MHNQQEQSGKRIWTYFYDKRNDSMKPFPVKSFGSRVNASLENGTRKDFILDIPLRDIFNLFK